MDIRSYIKKYDITFQDMAERCKISRAQIYYLLQGRDVASSVWLRIMVGTNHEVDLKDLCGYQKTKDLGVYLEKAKKSKGTRKVKEKS